MRLPKLNSHTSRHQVGQSQSRFDEMENGAIISGAAQIGAALTET